MFLQTINGNGEKSFEITTETHETYDMTLNLIRIAIEKGMSIDKIVELREKIKNEIAEQEFLKAFTKFQSEIPEVTKDKAVFNKDGTIRYKYASYDNIITTIKPYLSKYGLSLRFETEFTADHYITVKCIIQHVLGHEKSTTFKLPIDSSQHISDIQRFGSTLTYAKRYALSLILGIASEEDNDGNENNETELAFNPNSEPKTENPEMIIEKQKKKLFVLLKGKSREERLKVVSDILKRKVETSDELTKSEASKVIDTLESKEVF